MVQAESILEYINQKDGGYQWVRIDVWWTNTAAYQILSFGVLAMKEELTAESEGKKTCIKITLILETLVSWSIS